MFLFIFESFGTSELILIGIVALIVFGPRKLPQIAKTIGKTMADFRKTTNEFKATWEREVNFEENEPENRTYNNENGLYNNEIKQVDKPVEPERKQIADTNTIASPEIKEISSAEVERILAEKKETESEPISEKNTNDKRSWL